MSDSFNAIYNPDYRDVLNPLPVGNPIDPCRRIEKPSAAIDFERISRLIVNPDYTNLFGEITPTGGASEHESNKQKSGK